jgi:uncharacterized glyoxalase superfamily protein PhnB
MVIEVDQLDAHYQGAIAKGLPIKEPPKDQSWGHRSFCVCDPNGLVLYLFREIGRK